jgi:hypothetical protein
MNKRSRDKLLTLEARCREALRDGRQSMDVWRGEMWAVIAAVHDLTKAGKLSGRSGPHPQEEP